MVNGSHDGTIEALKASPPVTVVALTLGGISLQDWVYILTIIYLVLQICWHVYSKLFRRAKSDD